MKIVREHINEKFTEEGDPVHDLGIGLIKQIKDWLKEYMYDPKYTINTKDWTINIEYIHIIKSLSELPEYIQFNKCNGPIGMTTSGLISLKGLPRTLNGNLFLGRNKLTSLEYCPQRKVYNFMIFENELTSLKGCPQKIYGNFNCSRNPLKSLDYMPTYIQDNFVCYPYQNSTLSKKYINDYIEKNNIHIGGERITSVSMAKTWSYL